MPISGPISDPGAAAAGPVSQLPTGTVTFLMTDIEGSTRLLQALGDQYPQLLGEPSGRPVKTISGSFPLPCLASRLGLRGITSAPGDAMPRRSTRRFAGGS